MGKSGGGGDGKSAWQRQQEAKQEKEAKDTALQEAARLANNNAALSSGLRGRMSLLSAAGEKGFQPSRLGGV